jgi:hypothetical protein
MTMTAYWFTITDETHAETGSSFQRLTARSRDRKVRRQAQRAGWDVSKSKHYGYLFRPEDRTATPITLTLDQAELFMSWLA